MTSQVEQIRQSVTTGKKTAVAWTEEALAKAKQFADKNIFLHLCEERALQRAAAIDRAVSQGEAVGKLAGVPIAIKDNMLSFDGPTTAASKFLADFEAPLQAEVVEKIEAEGAIIIGKTNLDAFAHGGSTENSAFGVTKNAVDDIRVAGGSSGGSAAVVALGIVPLALGTDTGGSIREPASFNGVVGVKPSYGLVSRFGVVAMASSTDVVGCLAKEVADADLLLSILAGRDTKDATTYESDYQTKTSAKPRKIGVVRQFMEGLDDDVKVSVNQAIDSLKQAGHQVDEVDLNKVKYALAIYHVVVSAEVSSNLARYDGVRYGQRFKTDDLDELYGASRNSGFETENKRRIMIGSYVLSSGYFDAYYLQAQKVRTLLINQLRDTFKDYDFLIGPVVPEVAFKIGENAADPIKMYMSDTLTTPASLAGLPALSLPIQPNSAGLPIGLQIVADYQQDADLMAFASQIEQELKS